MTNKTQTPAAPNNPTHPREVNASKITVRAATTSDLHALPTIELSAAARFCDVPEIAWTAEGDTLSLDALRDYMLPPSNLWVAVSTPITTSHEKSDITAQGNSDSVSTTNHDKANGEEIAGFAATKPIDDCQYIAEISVSLSYQGHGIGSKLVRQIQEDCRTRGARMVTLTTDRFASWNGPFYARRGFVEVDAKLLGKGHVLALEHEVESGFDVNRRCAMVWLREWDVGVPCNLSEDDVRTSLGGGKQGN